MMKGISKTRSAAIMLVLAGASLALIGSPQAQVRPDIGVHGALNRPAPVPVADMLDRVALLQEVPSVDYIKAFPDRIRGLYTRLFEENRTLKSEARTSAADIAELSRRLNEMTRRGGSLVRAYCSDEVTSRNTAGATERCDDSGYRCDQVSGLCHRQATKTSMCADLYVMKDGRCILPSSLDNQED